MSQVAKKTTSRGLPGPRVTVDVPDAESDGRAAGSDTAAAGVCTSTVPSDSWLSSFGWPGSSPAISVASTWADWEMLEYAIWVR